MKQLYAVFFFLFASVAFAQNDVGASAEIEGLKLFPNPVTQNKIYIETLSAGPKDIAIFDVLGTQVLQTKLVGRELNLSRLAKGVYIIRILENNKVATRKLIIK